MLSDSKVVATIAVSDIARGKQFYGDKLGLKQTDENPGGVTYTSGGGQLFIYPAPTAGKGEATCAWWNVDDAEAAVKELGDKGIIFEHYNMPGMELEGDLHVMGGMKAAWFKDPDGNVLGVGSG